MREIWRGIKGYENSYEVSNQGNIRSIARTIDICNGSNRTYKQKTLKKSINFQGYPIITVCIEGISRQLLIHRCVALAFLKNKNKEEFDCIDHRNAIKTDNRVRNLRWCTRSQNVMFYNTKQQYLKHTSRITDRGCKHGVKYSFMLKAWWVVFNKTGEQFESMFFDSRYKANGCFRDVDKNNESVFDDYEFMNIPYSMNRSFDKLKEVATCCFQ